MSHIKKYVEPVVADPVESHDESSGVGDVSDTADGKAQAQHDRVPEQRTFLPSDNLSTQSTVMPSQDHGARRSVRLCRKPIRLNDYV